MVGESAVAPVVHMPFDPRPALVPTVLHLQTVRHRVHPPGLHRIALQRLLPQLLRARIIPHLFQPEGLHAEKVRIPRLLGIPRIGHAVDRVSHLPRATAVQIREVRKPQRHRVGRMLIEDRFPQCESPLRVARYPCRQRVQMLHFPRQQQRSLLLEGAHGSLSDT